MRMSKSEFEKLYYSSTDKKVAETIGVKSVVTVRKYAEHLGLKPKGTGFFQKKKLNSTLKVEFF